MKKKPTTVAFSGTQEQALALDKLIAEHKDEPGALMPVLQGAQEIYGYLPEEVQRRVAAGLGVPFEEAYGVSTFYSQFSLNPKGQVAISVCLGTACYVKGSGGVLDKISSVLNLGVGETSRDGKYSLEATRCIGACGLAPVMTVNGEVYGRLNVAQVEGILSKYTK
ncbi:MAG: NAD(P)H-dependent oxidoreductase subunit E [Clostridia bacterium]|nr:NAD(P)H-dependent oxidoreductase subunit E [Clostridia bacterium]